MSPVATDPLSRAFAALSDPIRRDLVAQLAEGEATVGELAARHPVSKQAIAKHLQVLENAGLVTRPGDAYRKPVRLDGQVLSLMTKWIERYRRQAEARYQRIDDLLTIMPDDPPTTATMEPTT